MQSQMATVAFESKTGPVIRVKDLIQTHPMSNTDQIVQELHDILFAYYGVARRRFVDSICTQAADHYLVNGIETPLTLFSPKFVSGLSSEQLDRIAGEDQGVRRQRTQLQRDISSLQEAKKILR
jgi:Dynamin GTPase effector domain